MESQKIALNIVKVLNKAGYLAYFAGGWVRDYLMGNPSDDIDIATNAPPQKIVELFPKTIRVGIAFGVVIVVMNGYQFEVATFRKDGDYADGRKPGSIELSTPEEDASRRDFTINGLFYDPLKNHLYDYVGGKEDIKKKIIRTIGITEERFFEDRLRMIRAVCFAARFNFSIDRNTKQAIIANAHTLFPSVALERVWQELTKMSKYPDFDKALIAMHHLKLLPVIFPSLKNDGFNSIEEAVSPFKFFSKKTETILYLMDLFPRFSLNEAEELCRYLRTSQVEIALARLFVFVRKSVIEELITKVIDLPLWTRLYANSDTQKCLEVVAARMIKEEKLLFLAEHKERKILLKKHVERIVNKTPLIHAAILQSQGILPGKIMGQLIKEAEKIAIVHDLNESHQVLEMLRVSSVWPSNERNLK